jgi:DNA-directed RNA polymerase specialized sigma24 family protein
MAREPGDKSKLLSALQAVDSLWYQAFDQFCDQSISDAIMAHGEIEDAPVCQRAAPFYRHYIPLRNHLISLLAQTYRRYFRLSLANAQHGDDPKSWTLAQLRPALDRATNWIHEWFVLACDGENRTVRRIASVKFVPGEQISVPIHGTVQDLTAPTSWHAPSWLFEISLVLVGIGLMKQNHVIDRNSEERLGESHTRLLLKGARRVFLREFRDAIQTVTYEEIANAAAAHSVWTGEKTEEQVRSKESKAHFRGIEGLGPKKTDFSSFMDNLTEKQQLAFSLKFEYELRLAEIASRMGLDRKTAYEHIEAAKRRIDQARSKENSNIRRSKGENK